MSREFLIEFRQVGAAVKVSAVDPVTLTEVSIVGPASAGADVLEQVAIRKLERALRRRSHDEAKGPGGRGRIV